MNRSFVSELFYGEPAGRFAEGKLLETAPDLTHAVEDPRNGYWHCSIANHERLMWSDKVYELFGLPAGAPIKREWAVARYKAKSKKALERVRSSGLSHKSGFILDAEIRPEAGPDRWIRVLAVPIVAGSRIVGLHGLKRAL